MSTVFTSTNFARGYPAPGPQMATPQKVLAAAEALLNVVPADRIDADVPSELGSRLTKQNRCPRRRRTRSPRRRPPSGRRRRSSTS